MHLRLTRSSIVAAASIALLGGSLFMAPAATAATSNHKIDSGSKHVVETIKVGSHKDRLTLDSVGKKSTEVTLAKSDGKQYVAAKYKVALKNSHKEVIYTTITTSWRAINLEFNALVSKHKTDAALVKSIRADVQQSEAKSKAEVEASYAQLFSEFSLNYVLVASLGEVGDWIAQQPTTPATFDGFTPTQPADSVVVELSGTPTAFEMKATSVKYDTSLTVTSTGKAIWSKNSLAGRI